MQKLNIYTPSGSFLGCKSDVKYVPPRNLLTPNRLDVIVKLNYALSILGEQPSYVNIDFERLYDCHIQIRTGGVEPNSYYKKKTTADYKYYFKKNLQEIRKNGFLDSEPVQVSLQTGTILNGAHRLAVALALNIPEIPVVYDPVDTGRSWDYDWFCTNGFSQSELMLIANTYITYTTKHSNFFVFWPSSEFCNKKVFEEALKNISPVLTGRLEFSDTSGFMEFVYDIYSHDKGINVDSTAGNINEKISRLLSSNSKDLYFLCTSFDKFSESISVRSYLRKKFGANIDFSFDVVHCASNESESRHLSSILLSPSNIDSYNLRPNLSKKLCDFLIELEDWCKRFGVSHNDVCIVGGAVFDLHGLKSCDDLDIILPYRIRKANFSDDAHALTDNTDLVRYNYAREVSRGVVWTDDDLIYCKDLHVICRGFKFASLPIVFQRKRWSLREKDKKDISMYSQLYTAYPSNNSSSSVLFENSDNYSILLKQAEYYHSKGSLRIASTIYKKVIECYPGNPAGYFGLGMCAISRGDYHEAYNLCVKSLDIESSNLLLEVIQALKERI